MGWIIGLDVGQQHDFTAWCAVQQLGEYPQHRYHVRHLERFPLKMSYVAMCEALGERLERMESIRDADLVLDTTGVGRPFADYLRNVGVRPIEVTVTAGAEVVKVPRGYHVPKAQLITTLQLLLGSERLRIAADLPEAQALVKELIGYRRKITAALHTVFGAWREGQHDDLLFAAGLAVWYGEGQHRRQRFAPVGT
jgi:hypothetical protein